MGLFKKNKYYIKLYLNRIEVKDLKNGKSYSENSQTPYNNKRLLISDFEKAEMFIINVFKKKGLSLRNSVGFIQQMEMSEGGLSEVEMRILLELFERIGFKEIYVAEGLSDLTESQLMEYKK